MNKLSPAIRKAAILVSSLDDLTADALLAQMGEEAASRVRRALVELADIPSAEQRAVLAEFLAGQRPASDLPTSADRDVAMELSADEQTISEPSTRPESIAALPSAAAEEEPPFAFLKQYPPDLAARLLAREGAQTIAAVIAQLDPRLAARLLEELPASLASEALARMACLDDPSPAALADVAEHLRRALAAAESPRRPVRPLVALQALLAEMNQFARQRVLSGLMLRNDHLAEQLGHVPARCGVENSRYRIDRNESPLARAQRSGLAAPLVEFEDLLTLSDWDLRQVFAAADPAVVLLALTGAPESLLARIFSQIPPAQAATLRRRLACPGPVRLADIATAQEELAAIARRLAEAGTIVLPPSRQFTAAA